MPRELFAGDPSLTLGAQKWYTVPLSILIHVVIIGAVVVIPLMAADVLPTPPGMMSFVAPPPPPPAPPAPPPPAADVPRPSAPTANPDAAPLAAPETIEPEAPVVRNDSVETGVIHGIDAGLGNSVIEAPTPPPPPPAAPIRISSGIKPPKKIRHVDPIYSSIAQAAQVQGIVIIEATIAPDGHVLDAKVLRSIPLLDAAAREAVLQWQYTPTLLNNVPVPVIMTVTVNFQLR